jgi:hypothetical protein
MSQPGEVYECVRPHLVFTMGAQIATLEMGELIVVVEDEQFITTSIRVETGEFIKTIIESYYGAETTFVRVWP